MQILPLEEGELFANRYRIVQCMASGGMGAVYEAVHTVTERRCAIKVMLGHTVKREQLRKRFMQESKVAAQIGSEFIVDILDAGVDEKTHAPFLVMELLEGEDLGHRLMRVGRFSAEETVSYLWDAARALDRTHGANIVHRDLKASNLFLTNREDGTAIVKVLDFGVAKVMPLEATSEGATQTVGTPIYMAPEQFRAKGRVSPSTDIYALGMLAYTLLVGVHYWKDEHDSCENPFAFASMAVHGPKELPSVRAEQLGVTLPRDFDAWFRKATSLTPAERHSTATQAVLELSLALGVAPPISGPFHAPPAFEPVSSQPSGPSLGPLPETIESPSARLSGVSSFAPATGTPISEIPVSHGTPISASTGSGAGYVSEAPPEPSGAELGGLHAPDHTEVSLSVTSGGMLETDASQAPATRRPTTFAVASIAAVAVIIAGVTGVWWSATQAPATVVEHPKPAETKAAATSPREQKKTPPSEAPAEETDTPRRPVEVTPIEALPTAQRKVSSRKPARKAAPTQAPALRPEAKAPAAAPEPVPREAKPEPVTLPESTTPRPSPRESLYSRD